ncbi:MAG: STAS domain-containing protein [Cardiobacteriaceae bacterium]|nr:STAS domain-containing protein [Cardiobacteriaceae bacterium]
MMNTALGIIDKDGRLVLPSVVSSKSLSAKKFAAFDIKEVRALPNTVKIDCSSLINCDSAAIASFVWLVRELGKFGIKTSWENISADLAKLLDLYGLTEIIKNTEKEE